MVTTVEVRQSIQRFKDYGNDLLRSDMNTFQNELNIFLDFCENDSVFRTIHVQLQSVPDADFDEWYESCANSGGSMAGSASLIFPTNTEVRLALMYELLRRIRDGRLDYVGFAIQFFALGTNIITDYVIAINNVISRPLIRNLNYRLEGLLDSMQDDRTAIVPQANFQIIQQATNVIQQSASGSNICQSAVQKVNPDVSQLFNELQQALKQLDDYNEKKEEYLEILSSARDLAVSEAPKPSAVKALLSSLPQAASITSIIASILSLLKG